MIGISLVKEVMSLGDLRLRDINLVQANSVDRPEGKDSNHESNREHLKVRQLSMSTLLEICKWHCTQE